MGKECGNLGAEREEGNRDFELNLELSIGGYGKTDENCNKGEIRNLFGSERKREIQALRRQEARRKREERIRKSRGVLVEDKLFLEAQKLQGRVEERESRERDCDSEERGRKNELSLSLFTHSPNKTERDRNRNGNGASGVFPSWAYSDSEHSNGVNDPGNGNTTSNRSLEQCSSAVSDYRSISHKGGSSSDTGSHSSPLRLYPSISRTLESHDSWSQSQPETDQVVGATLSNPNSNWRTPSGISSRPETSLDQTSDKSPKPAPNNNINAAASMPKMPCVSATGNGPNARTITGFLYKYTKTEVSIMCVCHGSSFSPAGFVEHAGGIDISHPLKHITIVSR